MDEKAALAVETTAPGDASSKGELAGEILEIFKQAQAVLRDAPWVGLGAVFTAMGAALLYFYFQSIDHLPSDIPALLGASAAVAALAFMFMLLMAMALMAPRWGFQSAGLAAGADPEAFKKRLWGLDWLLVAFQLLGPGAFLLYVAIDMRVACKLGWAYPAMPGLVFFLCGLGGWWREERGKFDGPLWPRCKRLFRCLWVPVWSFFSFFALFWVLIPDQGTEWLDWVMVLVAWLAMVFVNAMLNRALPVWVLAFIALMLLPMFLFSVPALAGRPATFPTKVALLAGIRGQHSTELLVPKATCALIQSGLGERQSNADLRCEMNGGWGSVKAKVLSNLGERWLIELALEDGGYLRITIPGAGVQTVRRIVPKADGADSCSPKPG